MIPARPARLSTLPLLVVATAALLAGCAGYERTSLVSDKALAPAGIRSVTVLPVIDGRADSYHYAQAASYARDALVESLRDRGYFTLTADVLREKPAADLDLRTATAETLARLAPEDADHFLVARVESIGQGRDREGQTVDATVAAALVDRAGSKVVWRDVATANSNLSGMLTVFRAPSREYEAAQNAARALVATLPDARPPKK